MTYKLIKHEIIDFLKQPPLWILVLLPIVMSVMIIGVMSDTGQEMMLLPSWILFAQVMVGIMITAPNFIEEKEHKTLDALMISPLTLNEVIMAKGTTILLFSFLSQTLVYLLNTGFDLELLKVIPLMVAGGILFIQIGIIIGLTMNSSKTASALSSIVMITLFLIGTLYQVLPAWEDVLKFIPSVVVAENIFAIFNRKILWFELGLLLLWILICYLIIQYLVKKELNR